MHPMSETLTSLATAHPYWAAVGLWLCWLCFSFLWRRLHYDVHKIPSPPQWPIIGHAHLFMKNGKPCIHPWQLKLAREYGRIYKLNILGDEVIFVCDSDFIQKETHGPGKRDLPKSHHYDFFSGVFTANRTGLFLRSHSDAKYKMVRKTIAVAFSSESLRKGFPVVASKAQKVVDIMRAHQQRREAFDMQELGVRMTFDIIGEFAFDICFDSLDNPSHPLYEALIECTDDAMADAAIPLRPTVRRCLPFLGFARRARGAYRRLNAQYDKVVEEVFSKGEPDKDDQSMGACLRRLRSLEVNLTQEELRAELATLLVAGMDTTGHQLAWTLCLLATHPDIQRKVVDELHAAGLRPGGREPTYDDLSQLKFLGAVVKEALRFLPVAATGSLRVAQKDMVVLGYRVPKGAVMVTPFYGLNRALWYWEEPDVFKPERWEKEKAGANSDLNAKGQNETMLGLRTSRMDKLWTFSHGVRDCVGQRLAVMELQLALIMFLSEFWFELDERMGGTWQSCEERGYNSLVVACNGGIWLRAVPHSVQ